MSCNLSEQIFCTECEDRQTFPSEMLLYKPPGKTETQAYRDWDWGVMLTDRVWCFQCEKPSYVERVPSKREFEVAARFRSRPEMHRPPNVEDELLEIDDANFQFLEKHLAGRKHKACCLTCGSQSLQRLQFAIDRIVNFKHPYCGGALYLEIFYVNGIGPQTIRFFDVSGIQIEIQKDHF